MEEKKVSLNDFRNVCFKLHQDLIKLYEIKEKPKKLIGDEDISGKFDKAEDKLVIIHLSNMYNEVGVYLKHDIDFGCSQKISDSDTLLQRVDTMIDFLEKSKSQYLRDDLQDIGEDCIKGYSNINNKKYFERVDCYVEVRNCVIKACKAYETGNITLMKKHLHVLKELMASEESLNTERYADTIQTVQNSVAENE